MEVQDYVTISISIIALLFSFCSLLVTFLNFRRNATRLRIEQLSFRPNPLCTSPQPNILYLDGEQSPELWTIVPMLYLIIYVKIYNLSYTGITISDFIINDKLLVSKVNKIVIKEKLKLRYFSSAESEERDLEKYGQAVPISMTALEPSDYDIINIGDRIDSKSSIEGIIIIPGNNALYNVINEGVNKFVIVTADKNFDVYLEIDKTIIPDFKKDHTKRFLKKP